LIITLWTVGFETPVCKLYLLFISADAAQDKEKKEKQVLLSTGVLKSTVHTVLAVNCVCEVCEKVLCLFISRVKSICTNTPL
jgi:hypothetical protein